MVSSPASGARRTRASRRPPSTHWRITTGPSWKRKERHSGASLPGGSRRSTGGMPTGGTIYRAPRFVCSVDSGGIPMELGSFSVSLAVADLEASRRFYETLGFAPFHGDATQGWLILRNGDTVIG